MMVLRHVLLYQLMKSPGFPKSTPTTTCIGRRYIVMAAIYCNDEHFKDNAKHSRSIVPKALGNDEQYIDT